MTKDQYQIPKIQFKVEEVLSSTKKVYLDHPFHRPMGQKPRTAPTPYSLLTVSSDDTPIKTLEFIGKETQAEPGDTIEAFIPNLKKDPFRTFYRIREWNVQEEAVKLIIYHPNGEVKRTEESQNFNTFSPIRNDQIYQEEYTTPIKKFSHPYLEKLAEKNE